MEPLVLFIRRKIADNRDIKTWPRYTTQCTWYKQCLGLGTISFSEHKERIMWINWPDINTSLTPALQMGGPAKVHTLPCRTCSPAPPFWSNTFFSEFPHKKDNKIVSKTFQLSKILWHITVNSKNIKTDISCPHFNWRIGEKFIIT